MVIVDSPFLSTGTFRLFLAFSQPTGPDLVCYLPGLVWCRLIAARLGITNELHPCSSKRSGGVVSIHVAVEEEKEKERREGKKYRGKREEEEEEEEDWFSNEVSLQKADFSIERLIFERREQPRRKNHDNRGNIIREKISAHMIGRHWTIMNR